MVGPSGEHAQQGAAVREWCQSGATGRHGNASRARMSAAQPVASGGVWMVFPHRA
ncbi:hypothetical protein ACPWR0_08325 [Pandoraea pneumonica]|uniref:hypothetical protein n=1 Tax=Pandoraea pneumonica TaxID=2508299 RepID=UPI003CEF9B2A